MFWIGVGVGALGLALLSLGGFVLLMWRAAAEERQPRQRPWEL